MMALLTNIYFWMAVSFALLIGNLFYFIFLIFIGKKTHAIQEFKAFMTGKPIGIFYSDNRSVVWKPIAPEAGILVDKHFGAFIINERATYVDKMTKNILIPFDSTVGTSVNVAAAKLVDDLSHIAKDAHQFKMFRQAIATNQIDDTASIRAIRTNVYFGALKNMLTALIPHNINAKINMTVADRMKQFGNFNTWQIVFMFLAIFGAILAGALVIRMVLPN